MPDTKLQKLIVDEFHQWDNERDRRLLLLFHGDKLAIDTDEHFHKLWTKAVGTEGYDKEEWKQMGKLLYENYRRDK